MPSWWGKCSSKDGKRKSKRERFIDALNRKFRISSEEKTAKRSEGTRRQHNDSISERGFQTPVPSISPSPSTLVSRSQSFTDVAQPLPLPSANIANIGRTESEILRSDKTEFDLDSKWLLVSPPPKPDCVDNPDAEGDLATASISSDSSTDSDDPSDSRLLSPLTSDYENGTKTALNSPSSIKHKDQSAVSRKTAAEFVKPANVSSNDQDKQILQKSPKRRPLCKDMQNLQIPQRGVLSSAPESSISSPSRSPVRSFALDPGVWTGKTCSEITLLGSGQCSSPGSGFNSGHNSIGGDFSGQLLWPQSRCSPECSPVPSPRMTSPGPSSRIHSGAVTPLHPRASGPSSESPIIRPEDSRQRSHRLPLPPLTVSNTCPFSPNYSTVTSPTVPRSPARTETPASPGSRWKKGRLLGRGTFGHVYLGFDRESGEMCAMKEVTLFPDDTKSKESAQQLGQEIAILSRLRHPNIVQYYGSETIDDKLYIYLEYVSGGSIYKLLQEYGKFGENAIRSYTQQILSGLAYLHAKNTIHRDIKGANILVDPNGRVKLADFGMAKHITGQYCPLSFKGSPYWMAPEVIKNLSGCNLAVDIWSLGCTVLEMATTKPPWSQYEGVAAIFKIGNSKELPEIPDHLSDEGRDFVRLCLQRDPSSRPSAAQLLEHRFVKNAAPLERHVHVITADTLEVMVTVNKMTRIPGIGTARNLQGFDSEGAVNHHLKGMKIASGTSTSPIPRNMSCPISPIGSPILRSTSPQNMSGRLTPSPISSPRAISGTTTPLTGGNGGIPFHPQQQQPGTALVPWLQSSFYSGNLYQEHNDPDLSRRRSQPARILREMISSGPAEPKNSNGNEQPVLANHVSHQLLSEQLSFKRFVDRKPSSTPGRASRT